MMRDVQGVPSARSILGRVSPLLDVSAEPIGIGVHALCLLGRTNCKDTGYRIDVIGVGIGGSEQKYPPELYAGIYKKARQMGFHTTAHAGEAAGPDSIWSAIRNLKVERIGHRA